MCKKFTLIELLVVVAIIGILASLLMPSLQRAREAAKVAVCTSNQKQIGTGMVMYTDSNSGKYPFHSSYGNMMGKLGSSGAYSGTTPPSQRPLNAYIGENGRVTECPSDQGDSLNSWIKNCYDYIGTSYLVQWRGDNFAVENVTSNNYSQIHTSDEWDQPTKKILLSDWVWHGNRKMSLSQTRWHDKKRRRFPTLFSDTHVEYFMYPMAIEGWLNRSPDSDNGFY